MNAVTLEQVENMAAQLPPQEQLQLLARISERLRRIFTVQDTDAERQRREYAAQVEAFLAACDAVAEQIEGQFDSAADLRQIREERTERI